MKIALLLAFVAHLGVSLASQIEAIDTGDEKTVPELMAIYESLFGDIEPDSLSARRQALSPRSEAGGHQGLTYSHIAGGLSPNDGSISGDKEHTFDSVGDLSFKDFIPKGLNFQDSSQGESLSPTDYSFGVGDQGFMEGFAYGDSKSRDGRTTGSLPYAFHSIGASQPFPKDNNDGQKQQDGSSLGRLLHSDKTVGGDIGSPEHFGAGGKYSRVGRTTGSLPNVLHSRGAGQQSPESFIAGGPKPQDSSQHEGVLNDNLFGGDLGSPEHFGAAGSESCDGRTIEGLPYAFHSIGIDQLSPEGFINRGRKSQDGSSHGRLLHSDNTNSEDLESPEHYFRAEGSYSRIGRTTGSLPNDLYSLSAGKQSPESFIASGRKPQDGALHGGELIDNLFGGDLESPEYFGAGGSYLHDGSTTGGPPNVLQSSGSGKESPTGFIAGRRKPQDGSTPEGVFHSDITFGGDLGSTDHFGAGSSYSRDKRTIGGVPNVLSSVRKGRLSPEDFNAGGQKLQDGSLNGSPLHSDNTLGEVPKSPDNFGSGGIYSRDGRPTGGLTNVLHSVCAGQQTIEGFVAGGRKPQDDSSNGGLSSDEDSTAGGHELVPTYYPIGGGLSSDSLEAALRKWRNGFPTEGLAHTYDSGGGGSFTFKSLTSTGQGVEMPTYGVVSDGLKFTDGSVGGGVGPRGGLAARGRAFTDYSEGDSLVSANGLTIGAQVPSLAAGQDAEDAYYGPNVLPQTTKSQGLASQAQSGVNILDEVNTNLQPRAGRDSQAMSFGYPQTRSQPISSARSIY